MHAASDMHRNSTNEYDVSLRLQSLHRYRTTTPDNYTADPRNLFNL